MHLTASQMHPLWKKNREINEVLRFDNLGFVSEEPGFSLINQFFFYLSISITKTCLYNFYPLKPHFYIVKLGFTRVYIIFLVSAQNIDCGYSLEPPRRGGSNEYPQSMFWAEIWKISDFFYLKFFSFLEMKFSIYLNRRVFLMIIPDLYKAFSSSEKYWYFSYSSTITHGIAIIRRASVRRF